jgi:hypothetical protein
MSFGNATRREVLKRGGRFGLAATLGAGLAGMLGEGSSKAATTTTTASPAGADVVTCAHYYWRSGECGGCPAGHCCVQAYWASDGTCSFVYAGEFCQPNPNEAGGCPGKWASPSGCCGGA